MMSCARLPQRVARFIDCSAIQHHNNNNNHDRRIIENSLDRLDSLLHIMSLTSTTSTSSLDIIIKNPYASDYEYNLPNLTPSITILQIKQRIAREYKFQPALASQRLIYAGRLLYNEQTLQEIFKAEIENNNREGHSNQFILHLAIQGQQFTSSGNITTIASDKKDIPSQLDIIRTHSSPAPIHASSEADHFSLPPTNPIFANTISLPVLNTNPNLYAYQAAIQAQAQAAAMAAYYQQLFLSQQFFAQSLEQLQPQTVSAEEKQSTPSSLALQNGLRQRVGSLVQHAASPTSFQSTANVANIANNLINPLNPSPLFMPMQAQAQAAMAAAAQAQLASLNPFLARSVSLPVNFAVQPVNLGQQNNNNGPITAASILAANNQNLLQTNAGNTTNAAVVRPVNAVPIIPLQNAEIRTENKFLQFFRFWFDLRLLIKIFIFWFVFSQDGDIQRSIILGVLAVLAYFFQLRNRNLANRNNQNNNNAAANANNNNNNDAANGNRNNNAAGNNNNRVPEGIDAAEAALERAQLAHFAQEHALNQVRAGVAPQLTAEQLLAAQQQGWLVVIEKFIVGFFASLIPGWRPTV
jgi:hypothetical protein